MTTTDKKELCNIGYISAKIYNVLNFASTVPWGEEQPTMVCVYHSTSVTSGGSSVWAAAHTNISGAPYWGRDKKWGILFAVKT